jgi:hypothetical protein
MSKYQKRITSTFLTHCSYDKAYEWLSNSSKSSEAAKRDFFREYELIDERKVFEYLLLRRKNPLTDLGLAQFGCTPRALTTVFARGSTGARCAVLANSFLFGFYLTGGKPVIDLREVVMRGTRPELEALALNPYLPDKFYEQLISRTEYFAEIDENKYKFMLYHLGDNARLSAPYDETFLDGYADYKYHNVFNAAWRLCAAVPTTQNWASVLVHLLHNAQPPVGFRDLGTVIERWRIDPPKKEDDSF